MGCRNKYKFGDFIKNINAGDILASTALGPLGFLGNIASNGKLGDWTEKNAGIIGTVAGAAGGAALGNPMLGAQVGGQLGGMVQSNYTQKIANNTNNNIPIQQIQSNVLNQNIPTFAMGGAIDDNSEEYNFTEEDINEFAKGGWIARATKNMRKDKPCTGSKFGSSSCPEGSKRYNLAKTFKKMAKNRAYGGELENSTSNNNSEVTNQGMFNSINNGGTHESNPNEGINIGKNASVEEDEFIFTDPDDKSRYVFSNRLGTTSKSFAKEAKKLESKYVNWKNDPVVKKDLVDEMKSLRTKQEKFKRFAGLMDANEQMAMGGRIKYDGTTGNSYMTPKSNYTQDWVNYVPSALTGLSSMIGMKNNKLNYPTYARVQENLLDLTPERINIEKGIGENMANARGIYKTSATTDAEYKSAMLNQLNNLYKTRGDLMGETFSKEKMYNTQEKSRVNAANAQIQMQETEARARELEGKRNIDQQYLNQMLGSINQFAQGYSQDKALHKMLSQPNVQGQMWLQDENGNMVYANPNVKGFNNIINGIQYENGVPIGPVNSINNSSNSLYDNFMKRRIDRKLSNQLPSIEAFRQQKLQELLNRE